jgi:hypothetical protein
MFGRCPLGHGLRTHEGRDLEVPATCDICTHSFLTVADSLACSSCDFDCCPACADTLVVRDRASRRARAARAAAAAAGGGEAFDTPIDVDEPQHGDAASAAAGFADAADAADGEGGGEEDGEAADVATLVRRVEELEEALTKAQRRASRAKKGFKRASKARAKKGSDGLPQAEVEKAEARAAAAHAERVRLSVNVVLEELRCRADIAVEVLNRVILKLDKMNRRELRALGAMQQEKFLGVLYCLMVLQKRCYTASNSLDLRACEALPYSTMRRLAERLRTELIDGELCPVVIMEAPSYDGEGNPVTQKSNREQGIGDHRKLFAPRVLHDDKGCVAALNTLCADHEMQLSVPSKDGVDAALWSLVETVRQVLWQAETDENLRTPADDVLLRAQVSCVDSHSRTARAASAGLPLAWPLDARAHLTLARAPNLAVDLRCARLDVSQWGDALCCAHAGHAPAAQLHTLRQGCRLLCREG